MQYILVRSKNILNSEDLSRIKSVFEKYNSIFTDSKIYEWLSNDKKSFFIAINPTIYLYDKFKTFHVDENNNLFFIQGWLKKEEEDTLLDITDFDMDFTTMDGYFNMGIIGDDGVGEITSSKVSPTIFYAKSDEMFAISNRVFMLSGLFSYTDVNKKFAATHIQYQNYTLTFDTILENIYSIPYGSTVTISDDLYIETEHDYLYDKRLEELYASNKELYWDECFSKLESQAKSFFKLVGSDKLKCAITGGKDSRILLALYSKYVESAFTWGPVFSPEVIVGEMICNTLGIKHVIDGNKSFNDEFINLMEAMPYHIFEREFEISPWDFGGRRTANVDQLTLDGLQYVKVNPFRMDGKDEVKEFILSKLENSAITDHYNDLIIEETSKYTDEYMDVVDNYSKFAITKMTLSRGRWAAKGHESNFSNSFIICPLLSNVALTYAFNIPKERIYLEEFHYEMIKRANEDLLDIPLFGGHFNLNPIPHIENKIPGKLNYKNVFLLEYYDYIMEYINENFELISDVVKKEFIDELTKEKLFDNSKLSQILYNILQYLVLLKTEDYTQLVEDLDLGWKIDTVEDNPEEEDLNYLTLKAFIEYNKDLVELKKQFNTTSEMEKYNTCRIDIKNKGKVDNTVEIVEISDSSARHSYPKWSKDEFGEGLMINSQKNSLDMKLKCIGRGDLNIFLRSKDVRTKNRNKIPIYLKYKSLKINDEIIFDEERLVWHDDFYHHSLPVKNNEVVSISIEWGPF